MMSRLLFIKANIPDVDYKKKNLSYQSSAGNIPVHKVKKEWQNKYLKNKIEKKTVPERKPLAL